MPPTQARPGWFVVGVLVLIGFLAVPTASQQARQGQQRTTDVAGTVVRVDAGKSRITITAAGKERTVQIAADATILGPDGGPLADGLKAPQLAAGAPVTLTVSRGSGTPVVTALRLGPAAGIDRSVRAARSARGGRAAATPTVSFTPLTEFAAGEKYKGEAGGLYGNGSNVPPPALQASAEKATALIVPRDKDGKPAASGVIALVSISMSNATMEFSTFKTIADRDERKSPRVAVVDCAQGGQAMAEWVSPSAPTWRETDRRLAAAGVSAKQVQVAWIKIANKTPTGSLEKHGRKLYDDTLAVLRNAKQRFPNLQIAYLGSRIYGGYATTKLNPEPYAYEGAFVVRWLIEDQVKGVAALRSGEPNAAVPLLLWGPYLWANATTPRQSDGLVWERADLVGDGTHPSDSGRRKVANMLLEFFTSDPLAMSWFKSKEP